jgi:hypothetical protein
MSGTSSPNSVTTRFSRRHAEGIKILIGLTISIVGVVATYEAFNNHPKESGRLSIFLCFTVALIIFVTLLYRLVRTRVKTKWFWRSALLVSCWPLILSWGVPKRYGPEIVDPSATMAHRIPGYVLTVMWGLLFAWAPTVTLRARTQSS